jgi:hypothetical protein
MKAYRAYGLTFACERELPFAAADPAAPPDVTVVERLGQAPRAPCAQARRELVRRDEGWTLLYANPEGGWLSFDHDSAASTLTVSGSVRWSEAVPVLAGVACAVLLSSAGTPLLHGAALAFAGQAIAVLGDSGRGKSTLAAALVREGGALLSEDLLVIARDGGRPCVEPGHSRLSLLADSGDALGFSSSDGRAGTSKTWAQASPEPARPGAVPLRAVYILAPPDPSAPAGRAERLRAGAGAPALVRHLYGTSWIRAAEPADLAFCAALAAQVPVFSLSRAVSLERVREGAAMLAGTS